MNYVTKAVETVLTVCEANSIIVIESTISPGTIDKYIRPMIGGTGVHLAHAPERIIPGNLIGELRHNARVIGVDRNEVGASLKDLYATFCDGEIGDGLTC